jgi:hypothetical protein
MSPIPLLLAAVLLQPPPAPRAVAGRPIRPWYRPAAVAIHVAGDPQSTVPFPAPRRGRYFQQRVAYRIEAQLDDSARVLHGRARMRYQNRAPEPLDSLYFFLYLNAFRPNSAWARRDLQFRIRRFQELPPDSQAFERLGSVHIGGQRATPVYPLAPDSTVVAVALTSPLAPGDSLLVDLDWDARPSTIPRRQGTRGRRYDFAEWFPIVAVRDTGGWEVRPLLPQGEFYGEFMDFDVTLDLAADQVVGATGVPVEGDPGWAGAAAPGFADSLFYRRDVYGAPPRLEHLGLLSTDVAGGRRRVRWLAKQVHNFAWSVAPQYIYEGGRWRDIAIHVLYQPGDSAWNHGQALDNTRTALAWLDSIYGPFAWPQLTNLHRIEGGGTEFPMMVMNGGASLGLILHEVGHNYTMGILANNEWKEGFLDEGFTSFQTNWYWQTHGRPDAWTEDFATAAMADSMGLSQPLETPSARFRDFQTYQLMTYVKPSVVYRMLQAYLGDAAFRKGLRLYYERNRLRHVALPDFQQAMEDAAGHKLGWFFQEWFLTSARLDYAIGAASTRRLADGRWRTRVEVRRAGDAWMPVTLQVGDAVRALDSRARRQVVELLTRDRPAEAVLDPELLILDYQRSNNRVKL